MYEYLIIKKHLNKDKDVYVYVFNPNKLKKSNQIHKTKIDFNQETLHNN